MNSVATLKVVFAEDVLKSCTGVLQGIKTVKLSMGGCRGFDVISWAGVAALVGGVVGGCPAVRTVELVGAAGDGKPALEAVMPAGVSLSFSSFSFALGM
jgi:hypothetical protein